LIIPIPHWSDSLTKAPLMGFIQQTKDEIIKNPMWLMMITRFQP